MGKLLRFYWHPIAATSELLRKPVKPVRILGEDLVLFRDRQGRLGLIGDRCAHRMANLEFGYPVDEGLRCPYHGWTYDACGQCVAQPAEPEGSAFKDRIKLQAYPVQELAGLAFAYLGEQPAPLLPRWEPLVRDDLTRRIYFSEIPCNWLQEMENSPDQTHIEWLHGHYARYLLDAKGCPEDSPLYRFTMPFLQRHIDHAADPFEYGLIRRRLREGKTREDEPWRVGQPLMMPNMNMISNAGSMTLIWRTPLDDTHNIQWDLECIPLDQDESATAPDVVPCFEIPLRTESGEWNSEYVRVQDHLACFAQGEIMDRTQEHLGESDKAVILYRRLLSEQLAIVEAGGEPMNVFRDPAQNVSIKLPVIMAGHRGSSGQGSAGLAERAIEGLLQVG